MKNEETIDRNDNSINIGNGNKIKNSNIGNNKISTNKRKSFVEKHPIISSIIGAFIAGILIYVFLETNLWELIKSFVEKLGI